MAARLRRCHRPCGDERRLFERTSIREQQSQGERAGVDAEILVGKLDLAEHPLGLIVRT
jgi:hypothetical protein